MLLKSSQNQFFALIDARKIILKNNKKQPNFLTKISNLLTFFNTEILAQFGVII